MPESAGVLVGRRVELETLGSALDGLELTAQGILQIAGEQGIGKTRLVSEACIEAERRRYLVFRGRSAEFESGEAFGLLTDALDDYLASLDRREVKDLDVELDELAGVFPAFGRLVERPPLLLAAERYRAHRAVRGLLDALSTRRPVVLALDDVHWADAESLELLAYLLRRPPKGRVLTLFTFRPAHLPKRLEAALDASTRTPGIVRLDLMPLTRGESDHVLGGRVPPAARGELYRLSGGNPFYLEELARGAQADGPTSSSAGSATLVAAIPTAVQGVLTSELEALSPRAHALIQGAAVVGDPFEIGLAASVGETPEGAALAALDELLAADLVRPCSLPRRFEFRHPIVRHAVYASSGAGWRLGAHARAAERLEAHGASVTSRAHHVERSARPGDAAAAALLVEAADASAGRAPATAVNWYEAALRIMPDAVTEQAGRLEVLIALAPSLAAVGRLEDSRAALVEALDLVPAGDATERVRLSALCASVERLLGYFEIANDRLRRSLAELTDPRSAEAAALNIGLSTGAMYSGDLAEMRARADEALAAATACGSRSQAASAAALGAMAESQTVSADVLPALDRAIALVDALTDEELACNLEAAENLTFAATLAGRYEIAGRHGQRGIDVARRTGKGHYLQELLYGKAVVLTRVGPLDQAREVAESLLEMVRLTSSARSLAWALELECRVATARGEIPDAVAAGDEALRLARPLGQPWMTAMTGSTLAMAWLEAGEPARCRDELLETSGGPSLHLLPLVTRCRAYEALVAAELSLGATVAAEGWASPCRSGRRRGGPCLGGGRAARPGNPAAGGGRAAASRRARPCRRVHRA